MRSSRFDKRKELVLATMERQRASDITLDTVRDTSLYEFFSKCCQVYGRLVKAPGTRVLMVTPGFSADSASVLSDMHDAFARSRVIAFWRMMSTERR